MKEIKIRLGKTALIYNVINFLTLIITIVCSLSVEKLNDSLLLIIPCVSILFSVILTIVPLLEKNIDLAHINFRIYQRVNMSISVVFSIMQIALMCLLLSVGFNAHIMICIAIGILLMIIGNVIPKMKIGSIFSSFFPVLKNNYQAWNRFSFLAGFIIFIEGLSIIILGGFYKSTTSYFFILGIIIAIIIILYLLAFYYSRVYKVEKNNEVED